MGVLVGAQVRELRFCHRSRLFPRVEWQAFFLLRETVDVGIFGILLAIAGMGYIADAVGTVFSAELPVAFGSFGFVGEVAIIFWLLGAAALRPEGRRLAVRAAELGPAEPSCGAA